MYSPSKKNQVDNQSGGAYVSTIDNPESLQTPDISPSTLSTLGYMANISSFDEIASFSIEKISALIAAVTAQIATENANIIDNQTKIAEIEGQINAIPHGYKAEYDKASYEYISVQTAYDLAQSTLNYDEELLSRKISELMGLSSLSSIYESTVEGYQTEYSSIWYSIQANNIVIANENSTYQGKMRIYLEYQYNYSTFEVNLKSTLEALNLNSSILSTATSEYFSTSTLYGTLLNDYINFSTQNLSVSHYLFGSTNKHLCSLMSLHSTQLSNYLSTSTALYLANMTVSSAQATYDYRNALSAELSSIIDYNNVEDQIKKLLESYGLHQTAISSFGNMNDIEYFSHQVPPPGEELTYNTLLVMLSSLSTVMFSTAHVRESLEANQSVIDLATLKAILDQADNDILSALNVYYLAEQNERNVISTMSGLSTRIGLADISEHNYLSTLAGLSTIYLHELSTFNGVNDQIASYLNTESILDGYLRSSLFTLYLLSTQSSMYSISAGIYTQEYAAYSTLEGVVQSSIRGYSTTKGYLTSTINGLDAEVGELGVAVGSQFSVLGSNATIYYTNVSTDLNNELDAYKYGVLEWNSFIGYIASELLIRKLNLYTMIDSVTFSLTGNITPDRQGELMVQKQGYISLQGSIQTIIDSLNDLDAEFTSIISVIETERQEKAGFVTTRTKLSKYEMQVLQDPTQYSVVQTDYIFQLSNLNARVMAINSKILQRNQKMIAIYEIINPQLTLLQGLNIFSYTVPDPLDTNVGPFNTDMTEYEILPQLNYGLNQNTYPLVLTSRRPSTIMGMDDVLSTMKTGTNQSLFY
jgi:hypothetical protein